MKPHPALTPRQEARAERNLYAAMLTLRSVDELRAFFRDLCTPAEIEAMAGRWSVVECLERDLPYREIHRLTGVSVTTIARVARCRVDGEDGYGLAAQRLGSARATTGGGR
jgi:TrpR-related protein YerC/YecD